MAQINCLRAPAVCAIVDSRPAQRWYGQLPAETGHLVFFNLLLGPLCAMLSAYNMSSDDT